MKAKTDKGPRWQDYMLLDELVPNPRNPKDHVVDGIGSSLDRFGMIDPIALDERTGRLISGHGRRLALLAERDAGRVPDGVIVDDDGNWRVPVNRGWSSKNDEEELAALVALNRWTERGGWQREGLVDVLETISAGDVGLEGVGFDPPDLNVMLAATGRTAERESSFLDGLLPDDGVVPPQPGHQHVPGGVDSVTLTLTFSSREDRDRATSTLRRVAADSGKHTMGDALLVLVEGVVGRVG